MQKSMNKKGQMNAGVVAVVAIIIGAVVVLALAGIVGGFLGLIQEEIDGELTENSIAWNNSKAAQRATGKLYDKLDLVALIIIIVIVLSLIIGVVGTFLYFGNKGSGIVG